MDQIPSPGRIVLYVLPETRRFAGEVRPAVITRAHTPCTAEIHPGMSNLRLFLDGPNDLDEADWVGSVMYDPAGSPGTWHWPPRTVVVPAPPLDDRLRQARLRR